MSERENKAETSKDLVKDMEPAAVEDGDPGYAFDGEQMSPMSPGLKRMIEDEKAGFTSPTDRACNVVAVALLFAIVITAIISIAAGACCLSSLQGKDFNHFPLFFGLGGVAPVALGCIGLVLGVFVIIFVACCAMGLGKYGMCCYGASRCRSCARVCLLGIFPFIVFIVLLAMCILGFTFFSLSQQLPPLDKDYIKVSGISGPIEIVRDENGLTHIKASSRRDAYFGQGFAQAQDRLFQLEFHRTVAKGELSSLVGNDGTKTDVSIRTINVRDAAYALCNNTSPELLDYFSAFAEGVNLYLERVSKRPVEFFFMSSKPLFFHDPKPFSTVDLCLTARLFQWQMSSNIDSEGQRFSVWAGTQRTYAQVEELYPDFAKQENTILNEAEMIGMLGAIGAVTGPNGTEPTEEDFKTYMTNSVKREMTSAGTEAAIYDNILSLLRPQQQGSASATAANIRSPHEAVDGSIQRVMAERFYRQENDAAFPYRFLYASNAWATRTADGHTVVASDPHLTVNLPSIWYYVHLSFPDENGVQFDTAGVGMTGISGVHIGKTTYVAWGITMSKTDLEDLFILPPSKFSGLPARTYRYAGANRVFVARRERILVKGKEDIVVDVDDTLLGPVVSTMLGFPPSLTVTLRATPLLHDDDTSIRALLGWSDPATNTAEKFMNTLLDLQAPGFSIPIGDVHGGLAYGVTGRHPLRNMGHTGKFPTAGFDATLLLTVLKQAAANSTAAGVPLDMNAVLAKVPALLASSNWRSYPATTTDGSDLRIQKEFNPHVSFPFDNAAYHISAANQKVTPQGFPYYLGGDYSWPYRGRRVQETLNANTATLDDVQLHMDLQRDYRSNMWLYDMRDVVANASFAAAMADNSRAADWVDRLLNRWDGTAPIGSRETSFLWRWIARMSVLPRDAIKAAGVEVWSPVNQYLTTMLKSPSAGMLAECASYMNIAVSDNACLEFAYKQFKDQCTEGEKEWGKDLNILRGIHEMVEKKIIHPLFRREMTKPGDRTSVGVSDHVVTGDMLSTQAASVRQVFDLWNDTTVTHFSFPGGNSGNPYSKYYQNLWDLFHDDIYVTPKAAASVWDKIDVAHRQTLSH